MASTRALASISMLLSALLACSSDDEDGSRFGVGGTTSGGGGEAAAGGSLSIGAGGRATTTGTAGGAVAGSGPTAGGGGAIEFTPQVACGGAVCEKATPVCCVPVDGPPSCAAYMGSLSCGEGPATTMFCDDSGDCLAGQVCCVDATGNSGAVYTCAFAPCATHEACTPGGSCEQPDFMCVEDAAQASGAKCVPG